MIKKKIMDSECGHGYREEKGNVFSLSFGRVRAAMKASPLVFTEPPLTDVQLEAIEKEEKSTYLAYKTGGMAQKGAHDIAHRVSIKALDDIANYVNEKAHGDAVIVTLGGYKPTSTTRVKAVKPNQPTGVVVGRDTAAGEMFALCDSFGTNHKYGCIVSDKLLPDGVGITDGGQLTIPAGITANIIFDLNQSRFKQFRGLVSGVIYHFYFFIVNAAGVSTLSTVVSLRCG